MAIGHLQDFAARVQQGLESADWESRRKIIRALVKSVKIETNQVRITYRISPPPFADGPHEASFCTIVRGALGRSDRRLRPFAVFADPGTKPFADQTQNPAIAVRCSRNLINQLWSIASKKPWRSASSTQFTCLSQSATVRTSSARWQPRSGRKP